MFQKALRNCEAVLALSNVFSMRSDGFLFLDVISVY